MTDPTSNRSAGDADEQIVGLELAGEQYGINIGRIREIIRMQPVTRVPGGPAYMDGITSLRGSVIPVLDLRRRFGLDVGDASPRGRIVVTELGEHTVGLVVDGVTEVLRVPGESVEPPSALVTAADSAHLRGVAKLGERLVLLIEPDRLLTSDEARELAA